MCVIVYSHMCDMYTVLCVFNNTNDTGQASGKSRACVTYVAFLSCIIHQDIIARLHLQNVLDACDTRQVDDVPIVHL